MSTFDFGAVGPGLPTTMALAAVALVGYLFGSRTRQQNEDLSSERLVRGAEIARQLEAVAASLRYDLAKHQTEVIRFQDAIDQARSSEDDPAESLREEAERLIHPTLRLTGSVAKAYDQIRRQSRALSGLSGGRTDPHTGLANRQALDELLTVELAGHSAVQGEVSLALFGLAVEQDASQEQCGQRMLLAVELLRSRLRDTDQLARYGADELVVVMPRTRLYGAGAFARRARAVLGEAGLTTICGLAQSKPEDDSASLLGRADSALYSAKAAGSGQYLHNGETIRADRDPAEATAPEPVAAG